MLQALVDAARIDCSDIARRRRTTKKESNNDTASSLSQVAIWEWVLLMMSPLSAPAPAPSSHPQPMGLDAEKMKYYFPLLSSSSSSSSSLLQVAEAIAHLSYFVDWFLVLDHQLQHQQSRREGEEQSSPCCSVVSLSVALQLQHQQLLRIIQWLSFRMALLTMTMHIHHDDEKNIPVSSNNNRNDNATMNRQGGVFSSIFSSSSSSSLQSGEVDDIDIVDTVTQKDKKNTDSEQQHFANQDDNEEDNTSCASATPLALVDAALRYLSKEMPSSVPSRSDVDVEDDDVAFREMSRAAAEAVCFFRLRRQCFLETVRDFPSVTISRPTPQQDASSSFPSTCSSSRSHVPRPSLVGRAVMTAAACPLLLEPLLQHLKATRVLLETYHNSSTATSSSTSSTSTMTRRSCNSSSGSSDDDDAISFSTFLDGLTVDCTLPLLEFIHTHLNRRQACWQEIVLPTLFPLLFHRYRSKSSSSIWSINDGGGRSTRLLAASVGRVVWRVAVRGPLGRLNDLITNTIDFLCLTTNTRPTSSSTSTTIRTVTTTPISEEAEEQFEDGEEENLQNGNDNENDSDSNTAASAAANRLDEDVLTTGLALLAISAATVRRVLALGTVLTNDAFSPIHGLLPTAAAATTVDGGGGDLDPLISFPSLTNNVSFTPPASPLFTVLLPLAVLGGGRAALNLALIHLQQTLCQRAAARLYLRILCGKHEDSNGTHNSYNDNEGHGGTKNSGGACGAGGGGGGGGGWLHLSSDAFLGGRPALSSHYGNLNSSGGGGGGHTPTNGGAYSGYFNGTAAATSFLRSSPHLQPIPYCHRYSQHPPQQQPLVSAVAMAFPARTARPLQPIAVTTTAGSATPERCTSSFAYSSIMASSASLSPLYRLTDVASRLSLSEPLFLAQQQQQNHFLSFMNGPPPTPISPYLSPHPPSSANRPLLDINVSSALPSSQHAERSSWRRRGLCCGASSAAAVGFYHAIVAEMILMEASSITLNHNTDCNNRKNEDSVDRKTTMEKNASSSTGSIHENGCRGGAVAVVDPPPVAPVSSAASQALTAAPEAVVHHHQSLLETVRDILHRQLPRCTIRTMSDGSNIASPSSAISHRMEIYGPTNASSTGSPSSNSSSGSSMFKLAPFVAAVVEQCAVTAANIIILIAVTATITTAVVVPMVPAVLRSQRAAVAAIAAGTTSTTTFTSASSASATNGSHNCREHGDGVAVVGRVVVTGLVSSLRCDALQRCVLFGIQGYLFGWFTLKLVRLRLVRPPLLSLSLPPLLNLSSLLLSLRKTLVTCRGSSGRTFPSVASASLHTSRVARWVRSLLVHGLAMADTTTTNTNTTVIISTPASDELPTTNGNSYSGDSHGTSNYASSSRRRTAWHCGTIAGDAAAAAPTASSHHISSSGSTNSNGNGGGALTALAAALIAKKWSSSLLGAGAGRDGEALVDTNTNTNTTTTSTTTTATSLDEKDHHPKEGSSSPPPLLLLVRLQQGLLLLSPSSWPLQQQQPQGIISRTGSSSSSATSLLLLSRLLTLAHSSSLLLLCFSSSSPSSLHSSSSSSFLHRLACIDRQLRMTVVVGNREGREPAAPPQNGGGGGGGTVPFVNGDLMMGDSAAGRRSSKGRRFVVAGGPAGGGGSLTASACARAVTTLLKLQRQRQEGVEGHEGVEPNEEAEREVGDTNTMINNQQNAPTINTQVPVVISRNDTTSVVSDLLLPAYLSPCERRLAQMAVVESTDPVNESNTTSCSQPSTTTTTTTSPHSTVIGRLSNGLRKETIAMGDSGGVLHFTTSSGFNNGDDYNSGTSGSNSRGGLLHTLRVLGIDMAAIGAALWHEERTEQEIEGEGSECHHGEQQQEGGERGGGERNHSEPIEITPPPTQSPSAPRRYGWRWWGRWLWRTTARIATQEHAATVRSIVYDAYHQGVFAGAVVAAGVVVHVFLGAANVPLLIQQQQPQQQQLQGGTGISVMMIVRRLLCRVIGTNPLPPAGSSISSPSSPPPAAAADDAVGVTDASASSPFSFIVPLLLSSVQSALLLAWLCTSKGGGLLHWLHMVLSFHAPFPSTTRPSPSIIASASSVLGLALLLFKPLFYHYPLADTVKALQSSLFFAMVAPPPVMELALVLQLVDASPRDGEHPLQYHETRKKRRTTATAFADHVVGSGGVSVTAATTTSKMITGPTAAPSTTPPRRFHDDRCCHGHPIYTHLVFAHVGFRYYYDHTMQWLHGRLTVVAAASHFATAPAHTRCPPLPVPVSATIVGGASTTTCIAGGANDATSTSSNSSTTFAIPLGSITLVAGPSGCGKSTLLKLMRRDMDAAYRDDSGGGCGGGIFFTAIHDKSGGRGGGEGGDDGDGGTHYAAATTSTGSVPPPVPTPSPILLHNDADRLECAFSIDTLRRMVVAMPQTPPPFPDLPTASFTGNAALLWNHISNVNTATAAQGNNDSSSCGGSNRHHRHHHHRSISLAPGSVAAYIASEAAPILQAFHHRPRRPQASPGRAPSRDTAAVSLQLTMEDIQLAARLAAAEEFILARPGGFEHCPHIRYPPTAAAFPLPPDSPSLTDNTTNDNDKGRDNNDDGGAVGSISTRPSIAAFTTTITTRSNALTVGGGGNGLSMSVGFFSSGELQRLSLARTILTLIVQRNVLIHLQREKGKEIEEEEIERQIKYSHHQKASRSRSRSRSDAPMMMFLLLDEPTCRVDVFTERAMLQSLTTLHRAFNDHPNHEQEGQPSSATAGGGVGGSATPVCNGSGCRVKGGVGLTILLVSHRCEAAATIATHILQLE